MIVNGNDKCTDFGNRECSDFGNSNAPISVTTIHNYADWLGEPDCSVDGVIMMDVPAPMSERQTAAPW